VDDGKSTLIGRLLVDSRAVLQDQLASVSRSGETDLALLTDGLSAEREQGITIDVAYRYFATPARKFIIGDAPGHEQYTRNMVTAASGADAAVVLVDATKLKWQNPGLELLPQTRRHTLLCKLLRVPAIVFTVNKLDAVEDPTVAFTNIRDALERFTEAAGIHARAVVPISALKGHNVVEALRAGAATRALSLLPLLEQLDVTPAETTEAFAFPVQWVEKFSVLVGHLAGPPRVLGPRGHRQRAAGPGRHRASQRPDREGRAGAGSRPPADRDRRPPQRRHHPGPRGGRVARRLAAGARRLHARARDPRHHRLARRRAARRRARLLGAARPPVGQDEGQAHPPQAGREHPGGRGRGPPGTEQHRPRRLALQEPLATLPYARSVRRGPGAGRTASHKTAGAVLVG
jgi:signal recognition particle receptor subunit beta